MPKLKISVIIPTFNRAPLIGETIESLLSQERPVDEILIVDDGSADNTQEVLAKFGGAVRVYHQENAGKAAALNRALDLAEGDLIWINDDDDILLPTAAAALATPLETDPDLSFCAGRHIDFTVDAQSKEKVFRAPGYMRTSTPGRIFPDLLEGCHIFQPGLMVRKAVYSDVGPFRVDLMRSQDYEMLLRIARRHRGLQLAEEVFWHREHEGKRGQVGMQFAAGQNADRWAAFNGQIFTEIFATLEDHELFSPEEWLATPDAARPRLAQVARGTVQARQRMWQDALDSFANAAQLSSAPLTQAERALAGRATLSTLGTPELLNSADLRARLKSLGKAGRSGAELRSILRRSMLWQIKAATTSRDLSKGASLLRYFATS